MRLSVASLKGVIELAPKSQGCRFHLNIASQITPLRVDLSLQNCRKALPKVMYAAYLKTMVVAHKLRQRRWPNLDLGPASPSIFGLDYGQCITEVNLVLGGYDTDRLVLTGHVHHLFFGPIVRIPSVRFSVMHLLTPALPAIHKTNNVVGKSTLHSCQALRQRSIEKRTSFHTQKEQSPALT